MRVMVLVAAVCGFVSGRLMIHNGAMSDNVVASLTILCLSLIAVYRNKRQKKSDSTSNNGVRDILLRMRDNISVGVNISIQKVPISSFQKLKLRCFPEWLIKLWPVRYAQIWSSVEIDQVAIAETAKYKE